MYELITYNNVSNSPIKEFGTNNGDLQIVLHDKRLYPLILGLTKVPNDIIDSSVGKISIPLSHKELINNTLATLYYVYGLIDRPTMEKVLNFTTSDELRLSDEKITEFFDNYLHKKINTITFPYPLDRDGGLNPALKIFGTNNQNKIENGRWEIFVVLENEFKKVGLRSGVKSQTWDYDDLKVNEQFNFSLFSPSTANEIKKNLLAKRSGHPSLTLDFKLLDHDEYQTLPVFAGGWLIRNDVFSQKRVQVYWSSGRYNRELSSEQTHLLQLCVAFNLMTEYGKDFKVEFYKYKSTTMEDFISKKTSGEKVWDWKFVMEEVQQQMKLVSNQDQKSAPKLT